MSALDVAIRILASNLQIDREELDADTEILGNFPEFNSLTIVGIVSAIEEELDCVIEDDEINTEIFATVEDLADFIQSKSED
ncbi:MAG: acyl carrier protein [Gammaproteobacteria bacterium]|jgi:acyl carrier protein|nr:acyl carrier protein [Gammaproteobacteria bacterium]